MLKKNGGITLIALVITIIVLLILAGVSIAMLSGENGVLNRASQASVQNELGALNDKVSLFVTDKVAEYYEKAYVEQNTTVSGQTMAKYLTTVVTTDNLATETGLSAAEAEGKPGVWVTVDNTTTPTKVTKITMVKNDNKKGYTSTGTVTEDGKVKWKITVGSVVE